MEYVFRATPVVVATADVKAAVLLRRHPNVDYIEPETRGEWASQVTPWGITRIGAPAAWSLSTGAGIKLLIMDSGIMEGHPDLALGVRWRCINGSLPIGDVVGHGTHVGGTAGALNNATFVVGGSPAVSLWSANVEISGDPVSSEVACSTEVARLNGVHVVNMSFGLMPSTAVTDQIRIGYNSANMLFVASAGNTFGGAVTYPASLSEVIAVTATDINNARASFAARGAKLELAAPGVEILSTSLPTGYACSQGGLTGLCSGTSMAAPHVAAVAALVRARYPAWSNTDVRNRLRNTALPLGSASDFGAGLVQALAAVQ
ncbi:MAG: S8 family serine peptidase [Gemmatimonadaceae bacterium]|nr:S8 family serine peptidase [Gemmatimonadaceae bacterium]